METKLFRASTRGHFDHGWLDTHHTFSFADYWDDDRIHFGELRVINDDIVVGGEGFGTHPHKNMEIISIPLYGALEHRDSMGNHGVIHAGEVQVMSAGTGVTHSEFNADTDKPVNFFQIWILPDRDDVEPRYQQKKFDFAKQNQWILLVSPNTDDESLWIYQQAWLSTGNFSKDNTVVYDLKKTGNGVFVMVIDGEFALADLTLRHRDGIAITGTDTVKLQPLTNDARVLIIEVPV